MVDCIAAKVVDAVAVASDKLLIYVITLLLCFLLMMLLWFLLLLCFHACCQGVKKTTIKILLHSCLMVALRNLGQIAAATVEKKAREEKAARKKNQNLE